MSDCKIRDDTTYRHCLPELSSREVWLECKKTPRVQRLCETFRDDARKVSGGWVPQLKDLPLALRARDPQKFKAIRDKRLDQIGDLRIVTLSEPSLKTGLKFFDVSECPSRCPFVGGSESEIHGKCLGVDLPDPLWERKYRKWGPRGVEFLERKRGYLLVLRRLWACTTSRLDLSVVPAKVVKAPPSDGTWVFAGAFLIRAECPSPRNGDMIFGLTLCRKRWARKGKGTQPDQATMKRFDKELKKEFERSMKRWKRLCPSSCGFYWLTDRGAQVADSDPPQFDRRLTAARNPSGLAVVDLGKGNGGEVGCYSFTYSFRYGCDGAEVKAWIASDAGRISPHGPQEQGGPGGPVGGPRSMAPKSRTGPWGTSQSIAIASPALPDRLETDLPG